MKERIPKIWLEMRHQDRVFSRKPFHALEKLAEKAKESGVIVQFLPATGGYWVERIEEAV